MRSSRRLTHKARPAPPARGGASIRQGVEVNLFGMVFGVDLMPPALKLPIVGRLGFDDAKRANGVVPFPPECRCGWRGSCRSVT